MFDLIRKIWATKTVTKTNLFDEAPPSFRGRPVLVANECTSCKLCVTACPSGAIAFNRIEDSITISLSLGDCIFCGMCAELCETKLIQGSNEYRLATKNKKDLFAAVTVSTKKTELITTGKGV